MKGEVIWGSGESLFPPERTARATVLKPDVFGRFEDSNAVRGAEASHRGFFV